MHALNSKKSKLLNNLKKEPEVKNDDEINKNNNDSSSKKMSLKEIREEFNNSFNEIILEH